MSGVEIRGETADVVTPVSDDKFPMAKKVGDNAYSWRTSTFQNLVNYLNSALNIGVTDAEVETAYNNQVAEVSLAEAQAGTLVDVRRWSPKRVADAIGALAGGGGDMFKLTYDPTNVLGDAFDMDNMVEGTNLILTAAERTIITNSLVSSDLGVSVQPHLDVVPQLEAEAGTATTERIWTAQRVKQAIDALSPAGGGTWAGLGGSDDPEDSADIGTGWNAVLGAASDSTTTRNGIGLGTSDTPTFLGLNLSGALTFSPVSAVTGVSQLDITHTATEDDDHALEIDCDAAGFGDVKALDIVYITGAVASGEEESAMLINLDETAALGGDVFGLELLATDEGALDGKCGILIGATIDPLRQLSGTFANADTVDDNGTDQTTALSTGGAGNIAVFTNDNEYVIVGSTAKFEELELIFDTFASGSGIAPTFEYSTGAGPTWSPFSPVDGTNGARNNGVIAWLDSDIPTWATDSGEYKIRITRTRNTLSTTPILDLVQVAATTEYSWDLNGDIAARNINLSSEITGSPIDLHSSGDIILELGDAIGANKVSILNSSASEVASIDSFGNLTGNLLTFQSGMDIGAFPLTNYTSFAPDGSGNLTLSFFGTAAQMDFTGGDITAVGNAGLTGDIIFTERADHASTPGAGFGYLWVRNDAPNVLVFTDDTGVDTVLGSVTADNSVTLTNKTIDGDNNTISNLDIGNEVDWAASGDVATGGGSYGATDFMLIYEDGVGLRKVGWDQLPGAGGGITSLEGQTGSSQTFADDTNVTMVSSANVHTITWAGTLADGRIASAATWNAKLSNITGESIGDLSNVTDASSAAGWFLRTTGAGAWVAQLGITEADITDLGSYGDVSKVGAPVSGQVGVWTGDGTLGEANDISANLDLDLTAEGLEMYEAANDGSPQLRIGSSDTNELHIQAVYDSGAQTLDYVLFQTDTSNAAADKGLFRFNVGGSDILDIDDGGLELAGSVNVSSGFDYKINGTSVLNATTLGSAVVSSSLTSVGTIGTGVWQGTSIATAFIAATLTGKSLTSVAWLSLDDTDSAFDLTVQSTSTLTTGRTLTVDVNDADRTLTLGGNPTINGGTHSGTNTGDEPDATTSVKGIVELATQAEVDAESDTTRAVTPSTLGKKENIQRYRTIHIPAGAMVPSASGSAATGTHTSGTNVKAFDYFAFSGASDEDLYFEWWMPEEWDAGTIKAKFDWIPASGASSGDGVVLELAGIYVADDGAWDTALGTGQHADDTVTTGTNSDRHLSPATPAITVGGTPVAGGPVTFRIKRLATDGNDDMTEDLWLRGIKIQYQTGTTTPSAW